MKLADLKMWGHNFFTQWETILARRPTWLKIVQNMHAIFDRDADAILAKLPPDADTSNPGPIIDAVFVYIESVSPWWAVLPEETVEAMLDLWLAAPPGPVK